jgi:FAD/FMN-containing dehydrogenase
MTRYSSWGLTPALAPLAVERPESAENAAESLRRSCAPVLAYGRGRSYGDVCLNDQGTLLDTAGLARVIAFDEGTGVLNAEAGVTIEELVARFLPAGWFLPTTPGTKLITLGGAVANDVHGKNQHRAGSFGNWVLSLRLLRSSGETLHCSPAENPALFRATIGGLGLTGLILSVSVRLVRVPSPWITAENFRFRSIEEFYSLSRSLHRTHEFLFSWLDAGRARGVIMAGNWCESGESAPSPPVAGGPNIWGGKWLLNPASIGLFNRALWWREGLRSGPRREHWNTFFYPLDHLRSWNKLYGRQGFFEYQCLLPAGPGELAGTAEILAAVKASPWKPYLAAIKQFGAQEVAGALSFSGEGTSLIFDFPNRGAPTLSFLDQLDRILLRHGGRIYPAKDARMSRATFQGSFPNLPDFVPHRDPAFESAFWRRVQR